MDSSLSISRQYLNKIGFHRNVSLTFDDLSEILNLHIENIPFGNLDAFLGNGISVDVEQVAKKLLDDEREGYCLEQNVLTTYVLNELGFEAFNLLARVYYQGTHVDAPIKTHLLTIVKLNNELFLFDPGFGGMTPTGVLSLSKINEVQDTPYESFRLVDVLNSGVAESALLGMKFMLQVYIKDTWINVYAFNPEHRVAQSDIITANWYISTSPQSLFTQNLMFSAIYDGKRKTINNNVMKEYSNTGIHKKTLISIEDYRKCFKENFNLSIPDQDLNLLLMKLGDRIE